MARDFANPQATPGLSQRVPVSLRKSFLAPTEGLEPSAFRLTAGRSTCWATWVCLSLSCQVARRTSGHKKGSLEVLHFGRSWSYSSNCLCLNKSQINIVTARKNSYCIWISGQKSMLWQTLCCQAFWYSASIFSSYLQFALSFVLSFFQSQKKEVQYDPGSQFEPDVGQALPSSPIR